jgi:hypothetical protein
LQFGLGACRDSLRSCGVVLHRVPLLEKFCPLGLSLPGQQHPVPIQPPTASLAVKWWRALCPRALALSVGAPFRNNTQQFIGRPPMTARWRCYRADMRPQTPQHRCGAVLRSNVVTSQRKQRGAYCLGAVRARERRNDAAGDAAVLPACCLAPFSSSCRSCVLKSSPTSSSSQLSSHSWPSSGSS